jgi:hypothetical protein
MLYHPIKADVVEWQAEAPEALEQFQEKCVAVFRPELRKNKDLERFGDSVKR